jgi:hypothetical protein
MRAEIESTWPEGESRSQIVEMATLQAARRCTARQALPARRQASLADARANGSFCPLQVVHDHIRARIDAQRRASPVWR